MLRRPLFRGVKFQPMDGQLDYYCEELFASENKLEPLGRILEMLETHESLVERLSLIADFPLIILQILTDAFYVLNTEEFSGAHNDAVRISSDIFRLLLSVHEFREYFLSANIAYYVYPFVLSATDEKARISTLKLLLTMMANGMPPTMRGSELIPLLLKVAGDDSDEPQAYALDILNLALNGAGLDYAVQTIDRFQAIDVVLWSLFNKATSMQKPDLLRRLLKTYLCLCSKHNVRAKLREKLSEELECKEVHKLCAVNSELEELRLRLIRMMQ